MKFRGKLVNSSLLFREHATLDAGPTSRSERCFSGMAQSVEKLNRKCIFKLTQDEAHFIVANLSGDSNVQVWAKIEMVGSWSLRFFQVSSRNRLHCSLMFRILFSKTFAFSRPTTMRWVMPHKRVLLVPALPHSRSIWCLPFPQIWLEVSTDTLCRALKSTVSAIEASTKLTKKEDLPTLCFTIDQAASLSSYLALL